MPSDAPGFTVELPLFSGPFRLLAGLILERKMDVCDVPVAMVTERFLRVGAEAAPGWSLDEATWFVAVRAALLELKVGRLLPRPSAETEEDLLGGASPDLLYARSLELAAFRRVALDVAERMALAALMVPRDAAPPAELAHLYPDVMERITAADLAAAAARLLAPPPAIDLSHVAPIRVTGTASSGWPSRPSCSWPTSPWRRRCWPRPWRPAGGRSRPCWACWRRSTTPAVRGSCSGRWPEGGACSPTPRPRRSSSSSSCPRGTPG